MMYLLLIHRDGGVMHVSKKRCASTLIDAMVGTLIALDFKGQMKSTNPAWKMDWRCPIIMVGSKFLLG